MGLGKMLTGLFRKDSDNLDIKEETEVISSNSKDTTELVDSPKPAQAASEISTDQGVIEGDNKIAAGVSEPADNKSPDNDRGVSDLTEEKVLTVLSEVYDPEIPIDIVNLGLIYGIDIEGGNVHIRMTMTAPGCPASAQIAGESKILVEEIPGVESCEIELVWDPPWDPSKMSEEAQQSLGMF